VQASSQQATTPQTPASTPSSPADLAIIQQLEAQVLAAPVGYNAAPGMEFSDGLITPAAFDQVAGAEAAVGVGLLGGYETTYSSDLNGSSLDIQLLRFWSPWYAESYEAAASIAADQSPKTSAFPAIPSAIAFDGTNGSDASCCEHELVATKGSMVMVVDYVSPGDVRRPPRLAAWAEQQYARVVRPAVESCAPGGGHVYMCG
jgi:hypothetical protein